MISSKSRAKLFEKTGEFGQPLLELLQDLINQEYILEWDMVVVKPENDNRWQVFPKAKADELRIEGQSLADALRVRPDEDTKPNDVISSLTQGYKNSRGMSLSTEKFKEARDTKKRFDREHKMESKEHNDFLPNENQVTAKNADVKSFYRETKKKFEDKNYDDKPDESEMSASDKEEKKREIREKFTGKRDSKPRPKFNKTGGDNDPWKEFEKD